MCASAATRSLSTATRWRRTRLRDSKRSLTDRGHRDGLNSMSLITRAGEPAAITPDGMSLVTTELAPLTQRSPMVPPVVTTQLAPNQQLEPIVVGPFDVNPCHVTGTTGPSKRCKASDTKQP